MEAGLPVWADGAPGGAQSLGLVLVLQGWSTAVCHWSAWPSSFGKNICLPLSKGAQNSTRRMEVHL